MTPPRQFVAPRRQFVNEVSKYPSSTSSPRLYDEDEDEVLTSTTTSTHFVSRGRRNHGRRGDAREPRWRIPPEFAGSYEPDETGEHIRSIERTVIRRNGVPYTVRERLLKPMLHRKTGLMYVKLAVGARGRCYTLYEARR
jgi:hypothetical protein